MTLDSDVDDLIQRSCRFVAFLDVLGYGSIVIDEIDERQKLRRLYSLFEAVGVAIMTALGDADATAEIKAVSFSDSYYFSSKHLFPLLQFLEQVFAEAYGFQNATYCSDPDNWMPFFRAGIVEGWAVSFRDVTLSKVPDRATFRNPVGPAVAAAHELTEKRGRLPGMRCFLGQALATKLSPKWIDDPPHYVVESRDESLCLLKVPPEDVMIPGEPLVELAWPLRVIQGDNCTFLKPLLQCKRQFHGDERVRRHYDATVELFGRSVALSNDKHARVKFESCSRHLAG